MPSDSSDESDCEIRLDKRHIQNVFVSSSEIKVEAPPAPIIPPFKCTSTAASSTESELENSKIASHSNDFDNFHHQNESDVSVCARSRRSPRIASNISSSEISDGSTVLLIRVVRHLTNLDTELGILAPKVNELLGKAIAMEKLAKGSSQYLLTDESNTRVLETSKSILQSLLSVESVDPLRVNAVVSAIEYLTDLLPDAPPQRNPLPSLNACVRKGHFESSSEAESMILLEKRRRRRGKFVLKPDQSTAIKVETAHSLVVESQPADGKVSQEPVKGQSNDQPSTSKNSIPSDLSSTATATSSSTNKVQPLTTSDDEGFEILDRIVEEPEEISTNKDFNISLGIPMLDVTYNIRANKSAASVSAVTSAGTSRVQIDEFSEVVQGFSKIVVPIVKAVQSIEEGSQDLPRNLENVMGKLLNMLHKI